MNDFKDYFRPFNIVYKKRILTIVVYELLTEDVNYILVIDWKTKTVAS